MKFQNFDLINFCRDIFSSQWHSAGFFSFLSLLFCMCIGKTRERKTTARMKEERNKTSGKSFDLPVRCRISFLTPARGLRCPIAISIFTKFIVVMHKKKSCIRDIPRKWKICDRIYRRKKVKAF